MANELGERLEAALKERGMNQKELATEANITEASVSHYIKGDRVPRSNTLGVIAGVLGVTAGFLLGAGIASAKNGDEKVRETFDDLKVLLKENKGGFSDGQKFELIKILSN